MDNNNLVGRVLHSMGIDYYQDIYQFSPIGIELFNEQGLLIHLNPAALNIFGIDDAKYVIGFQLFADPNISESKKEILRQGGNIHYTDEFDFKLVKAGNLYPTSKSGKIFLDVQITPIKDDGADTVRGYLTLIQDITEQVQTKKALEEYQRHLEKLVRERTKELQKTNLLLEKELVKRRRIAILEAEQRLLAETLMATVVAINQSLELDQVLSHILESIGKLISYDAVIVLVLHNGKIRRLLYNGFTEDEAEAFVGSGTVELTEYPNLLRAAQSGKPVLIPDTKSNPDWVVNKETAWIASNLTTPIIRDHEVIGFINIYSRQVGLYTKAHSNTLRIFASQAALAIHNAGLYERMQELAILDQLTKLYNRRGLYEFGVREVSRVLRFKRPLSALFIDIDHFKQFNDRYSYAVGDRVLQLLAKNLRATMRDVDLLARYGGEEFVVLLPEIDLDGAVEVAERLRRTVESKKMNENGEALYITISIGVAPLKPRPGQTGILAGHEEALLQDLVNRAGEKLHQAKTTGRNRVAF